MIAYIQAHDDKEKTIMSEFNILIAKNKKDKVNGLSILKLLLIWT